MSDLEIGVDMAIKALAAYWVLLLLTANIKNETLSNLLFFIMILVMIIMVILSANAVVGLILFFGMFVVPRITGGIFGSK